jgi:hypothetical protein
MRRDTSQPRHKLCPPIALAMRVDRPICKCELTRAAYPLEETKRGFQDNIIKPLTTKQSGMRCEFACMFACMFGCMFACMIACMFSCMFACMFSCM